MYTHAYIYIEQYFKNSACQNNSVFSQMKTDFPRKICRSCISFMILFPIFLLPLGSELLYMFSVSRNEQEISDEPFFARKN